LAEGNRSRESHLSTDAEVSVGGKVRINRSNAPRCRIDPIESPEGQARRTTGEFIQFISHAEGSVAELDTQLILSVELKFCDSPSAAPALELIDKLRRMLNVLRRKLVARQ